MSSGPVATATIRESVERRIHRWFPGQAAAHDVYLRMAVAWCEPDVNVLHLGAGHDALQVRARLRAKSVVAIDLDRRSLVQYPTAARVAGDGAKLPFLENSFKLILCEHVFEHLENPFEVLSECARVLRPGGHLVFLTPNRLSYIAIAAALTPYRFHVRYRSRLAAIDEADTFPTLYRLNTVSQIRKLGGRIGLELETIETVVGWPTYLERSDLLHRIGVLWHWLLERGPSAFHISLVGTLVKRV